MNERETPARQASADVIVRCWRLRPQRAAACALIHHTQLSQARRQQTWLKETPGTLNKGSFFIYLTLASLFTRFVAGKMADKKGRVRVFQIAMVFLIVAMLLIAVASSPWLLMSEAVVYGLASGLLSPASSAWTADLSHPEHRGRAMATMYIALEVGVGLGGAVSGFIFSDQLGRMPWLFAGASLAGVASLIYLRHFQHRRTAQRRKRLEHGQELLLAVFRFYERIVLLGVLRVDLLVVHGCGSSTSGERRTPAGNLFRMLGACRA